MDELTADLIEYLCLCRGRGTLTLSTGDLVPCPDCGDV